MSSSVQYDKQSARGESLNVCECWGVWAGTSPLPPPCPWIKPCMDTYFHTAKVNPCMFVHLSSKLSLYKHYENLEVAWSVTALLIHGSIHILQWLAIECHTHLQCRNVSLEQDTPLLLRKRTEGSTQSILLFLQSSEAGTDTIDNHMEQSCFTLINKEWRKWV